MSSEGTGAAGTLREEDRHVQFDGERASVDPLDYASEERRFQKYQ